MLKNQIKSEQPHITEADLMKKCMQFFEEQFTNSFVKDDSSMRSVKDMGFIKDSEESVLAGEGQNPKKDIISKEFKFHDEQMA